MIRKTIVTSGIVLAALALQLGAGSSTAEACSWWGCGSGCGSSCGSCCRSSCTPCYAYSSCGSCYNPYAVCYTPSPCNNCYTYSAPTCSNCAPSGSSWALPMYSSGCSSCSASSARPSYNGYASSRSASSPTYVSVGTQRYYATSGNASAVAASPATPRSNGTATPVRYVEYRKPSLFGLSR